MRAQAANDFAQRFGQRYAAPRFRPSPTVRLVMVETRIVFVGSPVTADILSGMLPDCSIESLDHVAATQEVQAGRVGVLILELDGPLARLAEEVADLRAAALRRPLPVLVLAPRASTETMVAAFEAGVADVAGLPLVEGEISARVRLLLRRVGATGHLRERARIARLQAMTDPVTRLYNRHYFDTEAERAVHIARRSGEPLALIMVDIDSLKPINDRYGHAAGDRVLAAVAERLSAILRSNDVIARFGGDEIVVAMPGLSVEAAVDVAQRLCAGVAGTPVDGMLVTVSIGVAGLTEADGDAAALLARADGALYAGKRGGRNRVEVAG